MIANVLLVMMEVDSPSTPASFMPSTIGPTLVLPSGKLRLRYPTLIPACSADRATPLAVSYELGSMP